MFYIIAIGMRPWDYIIRKLKAAWRGSSQPRSFGLDTTLQTKLVAIARQERRSTRELQADLIQAGLALRTIDNELMERWESLSPREQQVAALTCLGYTNAQISARLYISVETVKTHMRNILAKFGLHGKAEIKKALERWNFSEWEK